MRKTNLISVLVLVLLTGALFLFLNSCKKNDDATAAPDETSENATTGSSKTYTPPAQTGEIYIIVNYKLTMGAARNTSITVKWGKFIKTEEFKIIMGTCVPEGVVIKLIHKKPDQVPITVETNGSIISILQTTVPKQWSKCGYKTVTW